METLGAMALASAFVVFVTSIVALFRPLPRVWLPERKRAGIVAAVSFVLMIVGVQTHQFIPGQLTPQQARAEERRKAKWRAVEEKFMQDPTSRQSLMTCKKYPKCWGQSKKQEAQEACRAYVARIPDHPDYRWKVRYNGADIFSEWVGLPSNPDVIVYGGDRLQLRSEFGHFVDHVYRCYFDTSTRDVVKFESASKYGGSKRGTRR